MEVAGKTIGFAITGSFCTFSKVFPNVAQLISEGAEVIPIMSEISYNTDTRFGSAKEHIDFLEQTTGNKVLSQIKEVEPIGPRKMLDALVVAPCTGNTLAKIATGIADSSVTLAVKSHLRNKRPVIIAISTNDGLGNNAKNIGYLLNMKNVYLVPFSQDDCIEKENSLVAKMDLVIPTIKSALIGKQIQSVVRFE